MSAKSFEVLWPTQKAAAASGSTVLAGGAGFLALTAQQQLLCVVKGANLPNAALPQTPLVSLQHS